MQYRPEIDGLRALAILPVIFFHADFPYISGGFLGVDIFFVISGYLITSILIKENENKKFSIWNFYERRARRILPALYFVLIISSFIAWQLLSPADLKDYSKSLIATIIFVPNIYFWQSISYFDNETSLKPLLHMWSLGVEEQFYVIFPILLLIGWKYVKPKLIFLIISLFLLSLITAQLYSLKAPSMSFYWLPTRAWELLAGALCAFHLHHKKPSVSKIQKNLLSVFGLVAIVSCFFLFNNQIQHPSLWTLIPVLGTALIIIYAHPNTYVARLLSLRPLVFIGLLSYSAYLWHQPLFAFSRYAYVNLSNSLTWGLILLTFALATISWKWVEAPFRQRQFLQQRTIFTQSFISSALFIALAWIALQQNGFPQRFPHKAHLYAYQQYDYASAYQEHQCFLDDKQKSPNYASSCWPQENTELLIWGDSHAAALSYGLRTQQQNVAHLSSSSCPPLLGLEVATNPACLELNEAVISHLKQQVPPVIVLHASWLFYDVSNQPQYLVQTLQRLKEIAPASTLVVVGSMPHWAPSLITHLTRHADETPPTRLVSPNYWALAHTDQVIQSHLPTDVIWIDLLKLLCEHNACQTMTANNQAPLVWDYGHLTAEGSEELAAAILETLSSIKSDNVTPVHAALPNQLESPDPSESNP